MRDGLELELAGDPPLPGYLARPGAGTGPGLLVLHEASGLDDSIRDVCDRFARAGFVALAPDLYRGEATQDPDEAGRLMMGLEIPRAARDLDAAVRALLSQDEVEGALVPVAIDRERDVGRYAEPNLWIRHEVG